MNNMLRIENLLFYLYISVNFELIGVGVNNIYICSRHPVYILHSRIQYNVTGTSFPNN